MLRIKKNDTVKILAGKDKGKTGVVLRVLTDRQRVFVEKVNLVKKARRKTQQDPQGGFVELEAALHISNVMLVDKKANTPTRFKVSVLKDGSKVRVSKKSKEAI